MLASEDRRAVAEEGQMLKLFLSKTLLMLPLRLKPRLRRSAFGSIGILLPLLPASATAGPPPPLLNKTVVLTFSYQRVQRCDSGDMKHGGSFATLQVYVSGAGRLFARLSQKGGRNGNTVDTDPSGRSQRAGYGSGDLVPKFDGNHLFVDTKYVAGARRVQADFNSDYSSCSAQVHFGKENGRDIYHQGADGRMCTIISTDVSGEACEIQNGNAFAGN
jgi:hypothetical protein